jgi:hypothetical protein
LIEFLCLSQRRTAARGGAAIELDSAMPVRLKKLIGAFLLVTLVCVYAIVATIFAVALLGNSGPWVHLLYFFGTGFLWVLPAMFIISWMEKAPKNKA